MNLVLFVLTFSVLVFSGIGLANNVEVIELDEGHCQKLASA